MKIEISNIRWERRKGLGLTSVCDVKDGNALYEAFLTVNALKQLDVSGKIKDMTMLQVISTDLVVIRIIGLTEEMIKIVKMFGVPINQVYLKNLNDEMG